MDPYLATERFEVRPFSMTDYVIHISGGLLNLGVTCVGVLFLVTHAGESAAGWPLLAVAVLSGIFVADFVSGLLHWTFDTYFSDRNTAIERMVVLVREHHIHPNRILEYSVWQEAGMLSWFAAMLSAPLYAAAVVAVDLPVPVRAALVVTGLTAAVLITFMLEFHKAGHRLKRGRKARLLQKFRLLLAPEHHLRHHRGDHDINYCLINGIADDTLGRLGAFRGLERVIAAITGVGPREHDAELLARFDKKIQ